MNQVEQKTEHHLTDQLLITKILRGDTQAFGAIIKNTEGLVGGIVFKMIPHVEDRKDLVQDIYMKAFHKLPGFKFQSKLSTWIARITYNTCLNWLEKKKWVLPGGFEDETGGAQGMYGGSGGAAPLVTGPGGAWSGDAGDAESLLIRKEVSGILQIEIDRLSPVYRTLISLYHQEELSYTELAEITGLPEGTVKSYLFRARKKLKENILDKYKKEVL